MISFDTNVLVYATALISDVKVMRARDLIARAMRAASSVLLLQNPCRIQQCGDPQSENTN
jgi:predicted nucleic acid-binding protein